MNSQLTAFFAECHVPDPADFYCRCKKLYELLREFNKQVNLTRIVSEEDFFIKHIADSLAIAKFFPQITKTPLTLADIGCGGGFPSLTLALAFDKLQISAVDSIGRKTAFVTACAEKLQLDNVSVDTARARELNRREEWQRRFDIVTARAVNDCRTLWRECKNMVKPDGCFVFYKTPDQAVSELEPLRKATVKTCLQWDTTPEFSLPQNGGRRVFVYSSNPGDQGS